MKRPAELSDADRQPRYVDVGRTTDASYTAFSLGTFEVPAPMEEPSPPPFPWRRFLARLAVFAAVTLALALGAARVWR